MDADAFDQLIAPLEPAMVVVTTAVAGERAGCLVGFHSQASIEPRRYAVWLSKANHTYRLVAQASHVAVHFLTSTDHETARLFGALTGDHIDKFGRCDWTSGPHGVPLIDACPNRVVGLRSIVDDGGDHVLVVLDPVEVSFAGRFEPLRLSAVADIEPGHPAGERSS